MRNNIGASTPKSFKPSLAVNIMTKNMGTTDRAIRTFVALVIGVLLLSGAVSGTIGILLGAFAIIFLATSAISFCPLYAPFKISTTKK